MRVLLRLQLLTGVLSRADFLIELFDQPQMHRPSRFLAHCRHLHEVSPPRRLRAHRGLDRCWPVEEIDRVSLYVIYLAHNCRLEEPGLVIAPPHLGRQHLPQAPVRKWCRGRSLIFDMPPIWLPELLTDY